MSVLRFCPKSSFIDYGEWYALQGDTSLSFTICSKCYAEHISSHQLASQFARLQRAEDVRLSCDFSRPRALLAWQECLQWGNIAPLSGWLQRRLATPIPVCPGPFVQQKAAFYLLDGDDKLLTCCRECYEDVVCALPVAHNRLHLVNVDASTSASCDMALGVVSRAMATGTYDWSALLALGQKRVALPPCPRSAAVSDGRAGWAMPNAVSGLAICEACFSDFIAHTPLESAFDPQVFQPGWTCDLAVLKLRVALNAALTRPNPSDVFARAANALLNSPQGQCSAGGCPAAQGVWWSLVDGPGFELCDACYWCYVAPTTPDCPRFSRTTYPPNSPNHVCDLLPSSSRTARTAELLSRALATDDFAPLLARTIDLMQFAICPRDRFVSGTAYKWYGTPSVTACGECWAECMRGTPLARLLPLQGAVDSQERMCELYSDKMRAYWKQACDNGRLDELEEAARVRRTHFLNIRQALGTLLTLARVRNTMAMTTMARSAILQGGDAMVDAASVGAHQYGNSQLATKYATPLGVQAALLSRQASIFNVMTAGIVDPQIELLLQLWRREE